MPRNRRDLEKIEAIADRSAMMKTPLPDGAIKDMKRVIEDGLVKAQANPRPETRSLAEIVSDIENDPSKSQDRKQFELRIVRIADRIKDHLYDQPVPPLVRDYHEPLPEPKKSADSDLPLHVLIANLRQRLN